MNIQPISTCTQNCRIKQELIYLFQLIMLPLFGIYFDAKPLPVAVAKLKEEQRVTHAYPMGFASRDIAMLQSLAGNYTQLPFHDLCRRSRESSARHSPRQPQRPGRLKKNPREILEAASVMDQRHFKPFQTLPSYKPPTSIHSQQPNFPLNL